MGSPLTQSSTSDTDLNYQTFLHTIPGPTGRILPSASRWNSIELNFNIFSKSSAGGISYDSLPSNFSKSVDFNLSIRNKKHFKRFIFASFFLLLIIPALVLLIHFLPHRNHHHVSPKDLKLALTQALLFFDAQKSGNLSENNPVRFRGDSGLEDGNRTGLGAVLVGGFYDSGNNMKFSFTTAYSISLLSWTVIEYHEKYADLGELDHVKELIKWGSDYLLKLFVQTNTSSDSAILYSQVGGIIGNDTKSDNDITCWQRPEDITYPRPVSTCGTTASDLAGEIVAAMSAASIVFKDDKDYSEKLTQSAEELLGFASRAGRPDHKQETYTSSGDECGGQSRGFYNSSGFKDEMIWGGTWLFLATGNSSHLRYATDLFKEAEEEELVAEEGVFSWNNKLAATAAQVLMTRLRFFKDLGYPYEEAFKPSTNRTDLLMCSYLYNQGFNKTQGGLILQKPDSGALLQYAATASFLSKLYSDYLDILQRSGGSCGSTDFSLEMLRSFSLSQVNYILGDNPMKMSYVVGFGDHYPRQIHHRASSVPWDGQWHSCGEGDKWLNSNEPNPNTLFGAMVSGPDPNDVFLDHRDKPLFTEPTISGNAGLVAALIALHDPPPHRGGGGGGGLDGEKLGIDKMGMFKNIHLAP